MRPIRSGTISFGLVSVPVRMYSATESKELRFHFLHKDDLAPIGYDKVPKDTGERVDPDEVVRGFEIKKGRLRRKRRPSHRPDGGSARVGQREAEEAQARKEAHPQGKLVPSGQAGRIQEEARPRENA
jgi:hypothetical protein